MRNVIKGLGTLSAAAILAGGIVAAASVGTLAAKKDPACSASVTTVSSPWYFDVRGGGLAPVTQYSVFQHNPDGTETGMTDWTDANGNLNDTLLYDNLSGTYSFTINKLASGNVLESCSATTP